MSVRVLFVFVCLLLTGCTTIEIPAKVSPDGGALTESLGYVYDSGPGGIWYVIFIHKNDLLGAIHRHNAGVHLFLNDAGDLLFSCRCSGPGEVLDILGHTYQLKKGVVFLCDAEPDEPRVVQLPIGPIRCDGKDPQAIAKSLYEIAARPKVSQFLSDEAILRLEAEWKLSAKKSDGKQS